MYIDLAQEFINRYGALINRLFNESVDSWLQTTTIDGLDHKNRTKSNYIWDAFHDKLQLALANDPNFYFAEKNQTIFTIYKQTFLIKMKKIGTNNRASFIKTQQAENFQNQNDLGFGQLVNVYLYYALDTAGIFIDNIKLQCENGNSILWSFSIQGLSDITTPNLLYEDQDLKVPEMPNRRIHVKNSQNKEYRDEKAL